MLFAKISSLKTLFFFKFKNIIFIGIERATSKSLYYNFENNYFASFTFNFIQKPQNRKRKERNFPFK